MNEAAERLREALLEVYDVLPGPTFLLLGEATRTTLLTLARQRSTLGRGRVTNPQSDMRLKKNRLAYLDAEAAR